MADVEVVVVVVESVVAGSVEDAAIDVVAAVVAFSGFSDILGLSMYFFL